MNTHISYELSKKLKEFLGKDAPPPIESDYWVDGYLNAPYDMELKDTTVTAYMLHDLLSKPFCEAVVKAGKEKQGIDTELVETTLNDWPEVIARIYFDGGLPEVEKALIEMMEGK